jgi:hypothetical protein
MRVYTPSDEHLLRVSEISQNVPPPDRVTISGRRINDVKPPDESGAGIYFIGAMGANLIKIGWVRRLERVEERLARLQIDCPFPALLLLTVGPASRVQEGRVHRHFCAQHFNGEWFRCAGKLADLVALSATDPKAAECEVRRAFTVRFGDD